jgi:cytoskeletal protein CcmA (bactofilin family)
MAFWNSKSKDKFEDVDSIAIPSERSDAGAVAVVVTTVRHATSVIAAGVVVNGSISAPGDVQIEGHVIGDVRCATAIIGKDGDVKGNVVAETATIRGRVTGNVRGRTIQLASTGSVEGDLSHAVLIIEEGGVFEGRSKRAADPLSELSLSAPTSPDVNTTETVESVGEEASVEEPIAEPEVVAANEKEIEDDKNPSKGLDDTPRSAVADALGEKFAVAS